MPAFIQLLRLALAALLAPLCLASGANEPDRAAPDAEDSDAAVPAKRAEPEIIPPKVVYQVSAQHPSKLFDSAVEGEAVIVATVDIFGTSVNPVVERATHDEFGLAAVLAASEWIFEPATRNGVPIELKVRIPFHFKIAFEHRLNVELGREVYRAISAPVISSTELLEAPLPSYIPALASYYPEAMRGSGRSAAISLEFVIDPKGNVINPRVITASTQGFDEAAIRAVSHVRFKPVVVEGAPAFVSMMMPLQLSQ